MAVAACLASILLGSLSGCSRGDRPPTVSVGGKVTYQGKPVGQGTISFQPSDNRTGASNRPAGGDLQADGSYELSSFRPGDGAVPGEYDVVITSYLSGPTLDEPNKPVVWAIPQRYANARTSGLKAVVPAEHDGLLMLDFNLADE